MRKESYNRLLERVASLADENKRLREFVKSIRDGIDTAVRDSLDIGIEEYALENVVAYLSKWQDELEELDAALTPAHAAILALDAHLVSKEQTHE